jgi:hypothetical protein
MATRPDTERSNAPTIAGLLRRLQLDAPQASASRYRIQGESEKAAMGQAATADRPKTSDDQMHSHLEEHLSRYITLTMLDQRQKIPREKLDAYREDTMRRLDALRVYGTSHAYEAALDHMGQVGRFKCAFRILSAMEQRGVPIEPRHYAHATHACANARQFENALELLKHIKVLP